jgi:hypothetical protein
LLSGTNGIKKGRCHANSHMDFDRRLYAGNYDGTAAEPQGTAGSGQLKPAFERPSSTANPASIVPRVTRLWSWVHSQDDRLIYCATNRENSARK